jgi:hypothetical protein
LHPGGAKYASATAYPGGTTTYPGGTLYPGRAINTPGATTYSHGRMLCAMANEVPPARIAAAIARLFKVIMIILPKAYTHTNRDKTAKR